MQDEDGLRRSLLDVRREFIRRFVPAGASPQVQSVAGRFGMIAAAGELAAEYDVLPWPKGEALKASKECFLAWLAQRGTDGAMEDHRALEQIRALLAAHGESRFTLIEKGLPVEHVDGSKEQPEKIDGKSRTVDRLGFRRLVDDQWEFLIFPERWKDTLCKGADPAGVAKLMFEKGWLKHGEGKNLAMRVRLPGMGLARFYCVRASVLDSDE